MLVYEVYGFQKLGPHYVYLSPFIVFRVFFIVFMFFLFSFFGYY